MTAQEWTLYKSAKKKADDGPVTRKKLSAEYREKRLVKKEKTCEERNRGVNKEVDKMTATTQRQEIKICSGIDCPLKSFCRNFLISLVTDIVPENYKYDAASGGCSEFVERSKE